MRKSPTAIALALLAFSLFATEVCYAQSIAGIELSFGRANQQGIYTCDCGAQFNGGSGTSFTGSAFVELPLIRDIFGGFKIGLGQKNISSSYVVNEIVTVIPPGPDEQPDTMQIPVNRTATAKLSLLRFEPFVQYQVFSSNFFVQLGAGISIVTGSNFTQTRELTSSTMTLPDGTQISNFTFTNGSRSEEVENGPIDGLTNPQFSGLVSVGYNLDLGRSQVSPIVTYEYPFSMVSNGLASTWKIASLYGSIEFGISL